MEMEKYYVFCELGTAFIHTDYKNSGLLGLRHFLSLLSSAESSLIATPTTTRFGRATRYNVSAYNYVTWGQVGSPMAGLHNKP
jgi:hypothetical protein